MRIQFKASQSRAPKLAAMAGKGKTEAETKYVAAVFGVTGLVGKEIVRGLISRPSWKVYGISRRREEPQMRIRDSKYHFISCDLLNPVEAQKKLSLLHDVTHIFWVTWASQFAYDMSKCCEQNKEMMSNALNSILPNAKDLKHVSLQTGMKHYLSVEGPFTDEKEVKFYDENSPRVSECSNFYYVLEDLIREKLAGKVAWSVLRPGLLVGDSQRTVYNFMGSLCVYAEICKHLNLPFVFGGTRECWEEFYIDGSDTRLVAEHHIWAATNEDITSVDGQAFNSINGPRFTWKEIWPRIGHKFGVQVPEEMFSQDFWYAKEMRDNENVWKEIVAKEGLVETHVEDLANWVFMDVLFRCPVKLLGDREKSDRFGFTLRFNTLDSILYWIDCMRDEKIIPYSLQGSL